MTNEIYKYIDEDLPYGDLTTNLQENCDFLVRLDIFSRDSVLVSGSEISAKIGTILNSKPKIYIKSKQLAKPKGLILSLEGKYKDIHKAWKLAQIYLEYSCGIATYTYKMLKSVREVSSKCQILGTRKTFPFAKKLCLKALNDGGGYAHRLNLSDSVLFFDKHRIVYKNSDEFYEQIAKFKDKMPEKKITIEALNLEDALNLVKFSTDAIQLDKMSLAETKKVVEFKNEMDSSIKILSAGGINLTNAKEYANLGVDGVVTSAIYQAKMADIGAKIYKI